MKLRYRYKSKAEIPEGFEVLYSEDASGDMVLTGIEGVKTQEDVDRLQESLRKERLETKKYKDRLSEFDGLDASEVFEKLDRIKELEAAANDKLDETKMNELVEARIESRLAPVKRELDKTKTELNNALETNAQYKERETRSKIGNEARASAEKLSVISSAVPDMIMYAEAQMEVLEDGRIVTTDKAPCGPGLSAEVWLTEYRDSKPHWFPASEGAGAKGGSHTPGGTNPFSAKDWNMTEQGKLVRDNKELASQLAKAAGTTIGGPRPEK